MANSRRGFTVAELLVSFTLMSVILTALFSVIVRTQRDFTTQRQELLDQENLRVADLFIRSVLRTSGVDPEATGQALIDPDPHNTNQWDNLRVKSDFNPTDASFDDLLEDVHVRVLNDTLFVRLRASDNYEPYASPVRSLRFHWYDTDGTEITDEAVVNTANRVRFVLTAPPHPVTGGTLRREQWVFLRNRR